MIGKRIQSRTWSTYVVIGRGNPFMGSGNINKLVLAEGGEWDAALSLFIRTTFLSKKRTERFGVFECSFTHWANGKSRTRKGKAKDRGGNLHLDCDQKGYHSKSSRVERIFELEVAFCDQRTEVIYLSDASKKTKMAVYHNIDMKL